MDRATARRLSNDYQIPLDVDFYTLSSAQVFDITAAADAHKYRKPRNANGSRARYFHAALVRAANKPR